MPAPRPGTLPCSGQADALHDYSPGFVRPLLVISPWPCDNETEQELAKQATAPASDSRSGPYCPRRGDLRAPLHTKEQLKRGPRRQKDHSGSPHGEAPASAFQMENMNYLQGREVSSEPWARAHQVHRNPSACWDTHATGSGAMLMYPKCLKWYLTKGPDRQKQSLSGDKRVSERQN